MPILWNVDEIHRIRKVLQEAPESPNGQVTRPEAIRMLAPDIAAMRSKGYSLTHVAAMLAEQGLAVTEPVLKVYLRRAKRPTSRRLKAKKPPSAARAEPPEVRSQHRLVCTATRLENAAANTTQNAPRKERAPRHGNEATVAEEPGGVEPEAGGRTREGGHPRTPSTPSGSPSTTPAAPRRDTRSNVDAGAGSASRSTWSGTFVPREDTEDL
jgi:hypothetical protein